MTKTVEDAIVTLISSVLERGTCYSCKRVLIWGTLDKACRYCRGMYLYDGMLVVGRGIGEVDEVVRG